MKPHPIQRRTGDPLPVAFPIQIACMIEAHGPLYGYLGHDGKINIRPCDKCLDQAKWEALREFKDAPRGAVA